MVLMSEQAPAPESTDSDSDELLLTRFAAGHRESFGRFHARHAGEVQRFLLGLRLGLDHQQVEDVVQEVFLKILLGGHAGYDPTRGGARGYVLGIARHLALDLCRRPRTTSWAAATAERTADPARDVSERISRDEQRLAIADAMSALEPEQRTVLALRHMNHLKMRELADALSCSLPTARSRLRSAARLFAQELRKRDVVGQEVLP